MIYTVNVKFYYMLYVDICYSDHVNNIVLLISAHVSDVMSRDAAR